MNFIKHQKSLKRINDIKIEITRDGYDNIGKILTMLNIKYTSFSGYFKCDIIFINCKGGYDYIDASKLKKYVENGGIVYASDWAGSVISTSFPNILTFGTSSKTGIIKATVNDTDLKKHIGKTIDINFDLPSWHTITKVIGSNVILTSNDSKLPIMVEIPIGKGIIYFTSFHNHVQTTENKEKIFQLFLLKKIEDIKNTTSLDTTTSNDNNLNKVKKTEFSKPSFSFGEKKKPTFTFGEKTKNGSNNK